MYWAPCVTLMMFRRPKMIASPRLSIASAEPLIRPTSIWPVRAGSEMSMSARSALCGKPLPASCGERVFVLLDERAGRIERAEGLLRRQRRDELVIVPLALRLVRRLHLEQIHRVRDAAVDADLSLAE